MATAVRRWRVKSDIKYVRWIDDNTPNLRVRVPEALRPILGKKEITKVPRSTQVGELRDEAAAFGSFWRNRFREVNANPLGAMIQQNPEEFHELFGKPVPKQFEIKGIPASYYQAPPLASARRGCGITFESMFEKWSRGKSDEEVRNTRTEMKHFGAFIGSDDMGAAGRADFIGYKDHLVDLFYDGEITSKTVSNRWKPITALYAYALNNDKDEVLTDNFSRIKLDITVESEAREDFTPKELRDALLASWKQQDPMVRWFQWLGVFMGLRDSEIMRAHKDSIREVNGVWCFCVLKKYGLKAKNSERNYPLHSAIIAEGFLDYVASLPDGSRLFPDYNEDNIFPVLKAFYDSLGITKRFYSLRHTVTTHFRFRSDIDDNVKQYLMAHAPKSAHQRYGQYPAEKLVPAIETNSESVGMSAGGCSYRPAALGLSSGRSHSPLPCCMARISGLAACCDVARDIPLFKMTKRTIMGHNHAESGVCR